MHARFRETGPPEPVFNLEVHLNHVYHVAECGVLVHNGDPEDCFKAVKRIFNRREAGTVIKIESQGGPNRPIGYLPGYGDAANQQPSFYHYVHVESGKLRDAVFGRPISETDWLNQYMELNPHVNSENLHEYLKFTDVTDSLK